MKKLIGLLLLLLMFNWTAYSQITGISRYQKEQIVKGLLGYDECKLALDKVYKEKATVEKGLDIQKGITNTFVKENGALAKLNAQLNSDNEQLKSSRAFWKIFAIIGIPVSAYTTYRLCRTK